MNANIKWLRDKIKLYNMQGIIISNPVNIRYLTGIEAEGILLITRKENIYITDGRYIEAVNNVITIDDEIVVMDIKNISSEDYENFFNFCENVGFEENYITYAKYKEYIQKYQINNFEETDSIIEKQRMIKDDEEIEKIRKACTITDECFEYLLEFIKIGMTEKEIAYEIEKYFKSHGATLDFGCIYKGYCSDMTRTVFAGFVPEYIKSVYDLVLKNQLQTTSEYKDGANIRTISKMVEGDFKLNGFDLIHSLGHGVGLEIHELPYINSKVDKNLKEKMVVTNEPGIYIPDRFGIRIEDTILITKFGCESLTKSNRNYVIVDKKD